jgi:hypothetical protein
MCDADRCTLDCNDVAVGNIDKGFVKIKTIVVSQFGFEQNGVVDAIAEAGAESKVTGAGLRNAQRIEKDARFHAGLRGGTTGYKNNREKKKDEVAHAIAVLRRIR